METHLSSALPELPELRAARPVDRDGALRLLAEADAWTRAQGLSQWHGQDLPRQIAEFTARGELFILPGHSGMIVLQASPDPYWGVPDDGRAWYVHKLVVRADRRGSGLGARLLAWGEDRARAAGKPLMRLDCLAANPKLRAYYPSRGYRPVGEVESPELGIRMALFEKALRTAE